MHEVSTGMETEEGAIRIYGVGEDAIMAFTSDGVEQLKILLQMHRQDPDLSTSSFGRRSKLSDAEWLQQSERAGLT